MRRLARAAEVPEVARKVAGVAEILDVRSDAGMIETLEEAVDENRRLHDRLEVVVSGLEQALVPLLEQALADQEPQ